MTRSRKLAAIMFTDIEGYTALMQRNEERAIALRDKHRLLFNSITEKHNGRILQYYGDGTLSIFDSAIDAVQCGIEMQHGFQKEPVVPVRIGIHSGDIIFSEEEVIGDGVNVASRIESLAVPGSVFVSDKVYDEIKNQDSIETSRLKRFKLKNVEKPIAVYAISNTGLIVPQLEEIRGKTDDEPAPFQKVIEKPILATKLYIPPPRSKVVLRQRLIERLDQGLNHKLVLICAPAGFGKTTLASEWIAGCERRAAWLSLDESDSDATGFISYLIAALQTIAPNVGEGVLDALQSPQPWSNESILTALLNEVSSLQEDFILVLDDYHVLNSKPVDELLSFLLEHMPPQMHVVITTREDPRLPLHRLRARSQLTELRIKDLRFTASEASEFLNQVMGLNLSVDNIATLEASTEGWVAGLQMAALSMQGREDISGFIKSFAGDDRHIVDYLVEEVLLNQTQRTRDFLLETSILERLSGPLCDAVTGKEDGKKMLEELERENLFVFPLDDRRQWYRYHHLFAKVLHSRAAEEQPEQVPILHQRACEWYEHNNLPADAIHHALAAKDFEHAATLIELVWPTMDKNAQTATWYNWAKTLPEEIIHARPVLSIGCVWSLLVIGELEAAESHLQNAEQWLDNNEEKDQRKEASSSKIAVVDEERYRFLAGTVANARAYLAQTHGDSASTMKYAQKALDLLPEDDAIQRAIPIALLGFTQWGNGDLEGVYKAFEGFIEYMKKAGDIPSAVGVAFILAEVRTTQGRLREVQQIYERSIQVAKNDGKDMKGTEDLYRGLGELQQEWGNFEVAEQNLIKSQRMFEQAGVPEDWQYRLRLAQAQLKKSKGDLDAANDILMEAQRLNHRSPVPEVRPVLAFITRVWVQQGRLAEAQGWVEKQDLAFDDELSYLHEFEHIVLARVLISRYKDGEGDGFLHNAKGLLERLLKAAMDGGRMGSAIEIMVLQAIALEAEGDIASGLMPLERALILAEPEGYIRTLVDEGEPMEKLLLAAKANKIMLQYIDKLLIAFVAEKRRLTTAK